MIWKFVQGKLRRFGRLTDAQRIRRKRLVRRGFTEKQANEFVFYDFKVPYMRRFSYALRGKDISKIRSSTLWDLWRRAYNKSIALDEYDEPPRKRDTGTHHKIDSETGLPDYKHDPTDPYERERRATRKKSITPSKKIESPPDNQVWIQQLKLQLKYAKTDTRKEQLKAQIIKLGGTP